MKARLRAGMIPKKDPVSAVTRIVHRIEPEPHQACRSDGGSRMFDKATTRRNIEESVGDDIFFLVMTFDTFFRTKARRTRAYADHCFKYMRKFAWF